LGDCENVGVRNKETKKFNEEKEKKENKPRQIEQIKMLNAICLMILCLLMKILILIKSYLFSKTMPVIPLPVSTKKVLDHITKLVDVWEPTINVTI
jgi:hypothetical protein